MTRLDNDLISRKALLEEMKALSQSKDRVPEEDFYNLVTSAPTVVQDSEPILYWNGGSKFCTIKDINFDKRTGGTLSFGCDIPLYTSPPKREWRGLSDEEIIEIWESKRWGHECKFSRAIEAKLKELNHD